MITHPVRNSLVLIQKYCICRNLSKYFLWRQLTYEKSRMFLDQSSCWFIQEAVAAEGRPKELEVVNVVMESGIFNIIWCLYLWFTYSSPQFASSKICSWYKIWIKKYFLPSLILQFHVEFLKEIQCSAVLWFSLVQHRNSETTHPERQILCYTSFHCFLSFLLPAGSTVRVITLCINN